MNLYSKLSVVIALTLYLPLAWQILTKQVTQNLATFILWGSLDLVAAASMLLQGGNWTLPAAYVGGCVIIIGCLIRVRSVKWTWFETAITVMVVICLVGWKMSGARMATILSTIGVVLAGFPQLADSYKEPEKQPLLIYVGFVVVNGLSVAGGRAWTIEERFYPASCVVLCLAIVLATARRYFRGKA